MHLRYCWLLLDPVSVGNKNVMVSNLRVNFFVYEYYGCTNVWTLQYMEMQ